MAVRSGRYRHRFELIEGNSEDRDEFGAVKSFTVVQRPWCSVTPKTEVDSNYTVEFEVRYSKELENPTASMYIIFKKQIYDITGVVNMYERNEKLRITAVRRTRRGFGDGGFVPCPSPQ